MLRRRFMGVIGGVLALGAAARSDAVRRAHYDSNWSTLLVADGADHAVVDAAGDLIPRLMPERWTNFGWGKRYISDAPQQLPYALSRLAIGAELGRDLVDAAKGKQALITFEREGSATALVLDSMLRDVDVPILRIVAASTSHPRHLGTSSDLRVHHSMGIHWLRFQNPWDSALTEQFSRAVDRVGNGLCECTLAEMESEGMPLGELFGRPARLSAEILALGFVHMATTKDSRRGPQGRVVSRCPSLAAGAKQPKAPSG